MKKLLLILMLFFTTHSFSQINESEVPINLYPKITNHNPNFVKTDSLSFYQQKDQWQQIIDNYWGPGLPYQDKLNVFNKYADKIHDKFACFNELSLDWDSLRLHYYNQISDSTSKGRFSAILSNLAYDLNDMHTRAWDDQVGNLTALNPGTPLLLLGYPEVSHFGAGLTPLPDSSLLVFKVIDNHPLNLEVGDVILGYEGKPWKEIVFELLEAEIPMLAVTGSNESTKIYHLLTSAGVNWHLFDVIDILKYSTGDTVHLLTENLLSINTESEMYSNEQLPIDGVPMPDYNGFTHKFGGVTYGIISGTNIGYIYISKHIYTNVNKEFFDAISALMDTDGLIIDIRFNMGGNINQSLYSGFEKLINFSTNTLKMLGRCNEDDLFSLCESPYSHNWYIDADINTVYEKPISILVGPGCASTGDITAYRFKYLPTARFFGISTYAGLSGMPKSGLGPIVSGFTLWCPDFTVVDYYDPNKFLVRKEFPVDEYVWLTQDDVVNGDDTVVEKALAWIGSVAYAYNTVIPKRYLIPGTDTLFIKTEVENPKSHPLSLTAYYKVNETIIDSSILKDDGLNNDENADDGVWGTKWSVPNTEADYYIAIKPIDTLDNSTFSIPYAARFTTKGPISLESIEVTTGNVNPIPPERIKFSLTLKNNGVTDTVYDVNANIVLPDNPYIINSTIGTPKFGNIAPGEKLTSWSRDFALTFYDSCNPGLYEFGLEITSNDIVYWYDTFTIDVLTGIESESTNLPKEYALEQNYPNPFNPATTIKYSIPSSVISRSGTTRNLNNSKISPTGRNGNINVILKVFDILGREIATLVSEKQKPGFYEIAWDASKHPSGVYFYKLTAGNYVETKKMILLR